MRRSYRDAIVGFSLIGGVVLFSGLTFWLKGLKVSRETWNITANFTDATGLSNGTPVTFRGIQIGNVQTITFTPQDVTAKIRINSNTSPVMGRNLSVIWAPYVSATIPYKKEPIGLVPMHIASNPIASPLSFGLDVNCKIED